MRALAQKWVDNFDNNQKVILNGTEFETLDAKVKPKAAQVCKLGIEMENFTITSEVVMKNIKGLFTLQKVLLNPKKVKDTIFKLKAWFDSFTGNEEEAAVSYLVGKLVESIASTSGNSVIEEANVLMLRNGYHSAKNEAGESRFDLFDLIILTFISAERDGFYQLEVDNHFGKELFELGEYEDDQIYDLIAVCIKRLEIRVHLSSLIMMEEKRLTGLGQKFDICIDETWQNCRYSRIC